jgi:hypothetical protein
MSDLSVTVVLPSGGSRTAELPDDVAVKELLPELTTSLELPVTGPDGRPMSYRLDSKALGRELKEDETLERFGPSTCGKKIQWPPPTFTFSHLKTLLLQRQPCP